MGICVDQASISCFLHQWGMHLEEGITGNFIWDTGVIVEQNPGNQTVLCHYMLKKKITMSQRKASPLQLMVTSSSSCTCHLSSYVRNMHCWCTIWFHYVQNMDNIIPDQHIFSPTKPNATLHPGKVAHVGLDSDCLPWASKTWSNQALGRWQYTTAALCSAYRATKSQKPTLYITEWQPGWFKK